MANNKSIIRSVRLAKDTDDMIMTIAKYEDRTISNTLARLILRGLVNYIVSHEPDADNDFFDFLNRELDKIDPSYARARARFEEKHKNDEAYENGVNYIPFEDND